MFHETYSLEHTLIDANIASQPSTCSNTLWHLLVCRNHVTSDANHGARNAWQRCVWP